MVIHIIPFGRWKNRPLHEIDTDYLRWANREVKLSSGLAAAVAEELRRRGVTPFPPPPPKAPPRCPDCKSEAPPYYSWQQRRDGERVIRAECGGCRRFLAFMPLVEPYLELATMAASPTAALDALITADALGVRLKSDGESVHVHPADRGKTPVWLQNLLRQANHTLGSMIGRGEA
jgi:hypothetical protein